MHVFLPSFNYSLQSRGWKKERDLNNDVEVRGGDIEGYASHGSFRVALNNIPNKSCTFFISSFIFHSGTEIMRVDNV